MAACWRSGSSLQRWRLVVVLAACPLPVSLEGQHVQQPQAVQDGGHAQGEQDPGGDPLGRAAAQVEQDGVDAGMP